MLGKLLLKSKIWTICFYRDVNVHSYLDIISYKIFQRIERTMIRVTSHSRLFLLLPLCLNTITGSLNFQNYLIARKVEQLQTTGKFLSFKVCWPYACGLSSQGLLQEQYLCRKLWDYTEILGLNNKPHKPSLSWVKRHRSFKPPTISLYVPRHIDVCA